MPACLTQDLTQSLDTLVALLTLKERFNRLVPVPSKNSTEQCKVGAESQPASHTPETGGKGVDPSPSKHQFRRFLVLQGRCAAAFS